MAEEIAPFGLVPVEIDPMTGVPLTPSDYAQGKFQRIATAVGSGLKNWVELPGRTLWGASADNPLRSWGDAVAPAPMGPITEEEVFQQDAARKGRADWGAGTAFGMIGVGTPVSMFARPGTLGVGGGRLVRKDIPQDMVSEGFGSIAPTKRKEAITAVDLRSMPLDEAAAVANSERHIIPSPRGGYVGAPDWVKTPRDLKKMRKNFDEQVGEGLTGADWYARAQEGIKEIAGSDPARQSLLARELAQTSAQATPDANLGFGLTMHNAYEAGKPLEIARTGQIAKSYKGARDAGVDIPLGQKTGVYGDHLDPTRSNPTTGTNDIWHARAFDYRNAEGAPWDSALTPQQHAFMDAETVMAVDRANKAKLGGRSNWTAGEIQAAPWVAGKAKGLQEQFGWSPEKAAAEAAKTYPDYFDKYTAHGTHEATPGMGTGHLPALVEAPMAERAAFAADPRSTWAGDRGRDVIYDAMGLYTRPTKEATGVYQSPGGPLEINPAAVARPLVGFKGEPGARVVDPSSRAMLNAGEAARAYVDAQNAGAWSKPILSNKPGESRSLFVPKDSPLTLDEISTLRSLGVKHGLGDVVDYGQGAALTSFYPGPPAAKDLAKSLKGGLVDEISAAVPGSVPQRAHIDSGYVGYEDAWRAPPGSGAVTAELRKHLETPEAPAIIGKLDASPEIRRAVLNRMERDAELAKKTGQPVREDLQRARAIIAKDGFSGLLRAHREGVALPAAVLGGLVSLMKGQLDE